MRHFLAIVVACASVGCSGSGGTADSPNCEVPSTTASKETNASAESQKSAIEEDRGPLVGELFDGREDSFSDRKKAPEQNTSPEGREWVSIGPLSVISPPNWQYKRIKDGYLMFLSPEADKTTVVLTGFDTPEDGMKKIDSLLTEFELNDTTWHAAENVLLGEDMSFPAVFGVGRSTDKQGKGVRMFFAFINTGEPVNVLVLGGQDDDAANANGLESAIEILARAKRNQAVPAGTTL